MRLSISGVGESGKDTAAAWFGEHTNLRYVGSTSYCAADIVFKRFGNKYTSILECYNDRRNCRDDWVKYIDEINSIDKACLYKHCLNVQDILTGVRRSEELQAVKESCNIDLFIWIDRPGFADHTMMYDASSCDITILNDGNLSQFYHKLKRLAKVLKIYDPS